MDGHTHFETTGFLRLLYKNTEYVFFLYIYFLREQKYVIVYSMDFFNFFWLIEGAKPQTITKRATK